MQRALYTFILSNFPEDKEIFSIFMFRLFALYIKPWTTHIHHLLCSVMYTVFRGFLKRKYENFHIIFTNNYKIYTNVMLKWQSKRQNFFNILQNASYKSVSILPIYTRISHYIHSSVQTQYRYYIGTARNVCIENFNIKYINV